MMNFVLDRKKKKKNIVGKGENAGYQHFSPFLTMFSKSFVPSVVKTGDCELQC